MYTQIVHIIKHKKYQPKHLANSKPCKKHANIHSYHNLSAYRNICHIITDTIMVFMIAASLVLSYGTCHDIARVHAVRAAEQYMAATNTTSASVKYLSNKPTDMEPISTANTETESVSTQTEEVWIPMEIPSTNSGQKTFMDYRAITCTSSKQYVLQQSAWTDDIGLRRYNDDYMIALGTYYGNVGDRFRITLDTGKTFTAIMGDVKDNAHTDSKNQHKEGNIVEFIVDGDYLSKLVWYHGDVSYAGFKGKISSIEKLSA